MEITDKGTSRQIEASQGLDTVERLNICSLSFPTKSPQFLSLLSFSPRMMNRSSLVPTATTVSPTLSTHVRMVSLYGSDPMTRCSVLHTVSKPFCDGPTPLQRDVGKYIRRRNHNPAGYATRNRR